MLIPQHGKCRNASLAADRDIVEFTLYRLINGIDTGDCWITTGQGQVDSGISLSPVPVRREDMGIPVGPWAARRFFPDSAFLRFY